METFPSVTSGQVNTAQKGQARQASLGKTDATGLS